MNRLAKASLAALAFGTLLAGCATTVEMGGPLGSYRYHYDSRLGYVTEPAVVYKEPTVYHEPTIYRERVVTYRAPVVDSTGRVITNVDGQ